MHSLRHTTLWSGAAATLLELVACACNADESAVDALVLPSRTPVDTAQFQSVPADARPTPNPFANLRFRDQEPLVNRLRRLQALPFVTLWNSREATVYVGVDRRGKAGLHLRQKREDRGVRAAQTLAAPEDERPTPRPPKSRRR